MCYLKIYIKVSLMQKTNCVDGEWIEIKFKVETKFKMAVIANFVG